MRLSLSLSREVGEVSDGGEEARYTILTTLFLLFVWEMRRGGVGL